MWTIENIYIIQELGYNNNNNVFAVCISILHVQVCMHILFAVHHLCIL